MKKLIFILAIAIGSVQGIYAQDNHDHGPVHEGKWLIEINTGSWTVGNTGFSLASADGDTMWSIGAEGGYFVHNNLAIKAGLGYQDYGDGDFSSFNYKAGLKYYLANYFPLGVDYTGTSYDGADENPSYLGLQGGYAWFITPKVSIEPTIRYNLSLNSDFYDDVFQALIGFAIHL